MVFDLSINKLATESISKMEDSIVAILALNARKQGQIKENLDTSIWEQFLNEDELYGEQWLLCYEANLQGHLSKGVDYVSKDPWFSLLKNNGITFYGSKTPLVIPPSSTSGPSGRF